MTKWITTKQASELLGTSVRNIQKLCKPTDLSPPRLRSKPLSSRFYLVDEDSVLYYKKQRGNVS
jgi:hypothetical protein